jgi:hypothetical protein
MNVSDAPERRLGRVAVLILPVFRAVEFVVVAGRVVDLIFQFPRDIIVGLIQEPNQPIDLVPGFLAEAPDGLKGLFRGDRGLVVDRGLSRRCACRRVWCAIPLRRLKIAPSG